MSKGSWEQFALPSGNSSSCAVKDRFIYFVTFFRQKIYKLDPKSKNFEPIQLIKELTKN
jgi:hypothetical protein